MEVLKGVGKVGSHGQEAGKAFYDENYMGKRSLPKEKKAKKETKSEIIYTGRVQALGVSFWRVLRGGK